MLTEEPNLARAAKAAMELGPRVIVAKRGEYGAAMFTPTGFFAIPGFPLEDVRDPTGAGDSFAGGFLGYLDGQAERLDDGSTRRRDAAPGDGLRLGDRLVQRRGLRHRARIAASTREEIDERLGELRAPDRIRLTPRRTEPQAPN